MNANGVNIGREGESLNITNINLLIIFNKTREIVRLESGYQLSGKVNYL